MWTPTADVDRLTALLYDVLRALYPTPGVAMVLAAKWLGTLPIERAEHLSERDVAVLLLAVSVMGGRYGLFEELPLPYPAPLEHVSSLDRSWRTWGAPAGASVLRSVWRLVNGHADRTLASEVIDGYRAVCQFLQNAVPDERGDVVLAWLDELERLHFHQATGEAQAHVLRESVNESSGEEVASDLEWWGLPRR